MNIEDYGKWSILAVEENNLDSRGIIARKYFLAPTHEYDKRLYKIQGKIWKCTKTYRFYNGINIVYPELNIILSHLQIVNPIRIYDED